METSITDIYELSPMQQGMLFHTLYAPNSGIYFEQRSCVIRGSLNLPAFHQAWQSVVDRHPILRTSFHWEEVEKPLQVVHSAVELPWQELDWQGLAAEAQQVELGKFLEWNCSIGFDLQNPPLMRITIIRLRENTYQFIWSHHHLLMDGWCNGILLKEVFTLYKDKNYQLPPPIPYRNYILWLQQQNQTQAENYWKNQLQGFTAPTSFGVDYLIYEKSNIIHRQQYCLDKSISTTLQNFVRQHHITLNTLIQCAWGLLLSRYSGSSDIVFGTTVSGRPPELEDVENIVGLFINTLPVRVQIDRQEEVISWLQQLQMQQVEREQYSYSSLVEIQGWSEVERGIPLFDSLLVFENYPVSIESILKTVDNTLQIEHTEGFDKTNYPLTLTVIPGEKLLFKISYDNYNFDAATITRLLGHLETLLKEMVTNPEQRLSEISILTPKEQQQILKDWNQTTQTYPNQQCLHQLFETQVERTPDEIALIFDEQSFSYRELNDKANQLAHYLQQLGVKPETPVGICVERCPEMVIGMLGILKAGGFYVPLDLAYPQTRLQYILEDAEVKILLTHTPSRLQGEGWGGVNSLTQIIDLAQNSEIINQQPTTNPTNETTPENLAYLIYTSGSTGKPKGVMIEHRSPVCLLYWAREIFNNDSISGVLASTSICFDLSVFEIFVPLGWGGKVILAENALVLPNLPAKNQVTLINTVPCAIAQLLQLNAIPISVQTVNLAGEPLTGKLVQQLEQLSHIQQIFNLYGPSEDTTYSTYIQLKDVTLTTSTPPIGCPIANTQLYILDEFLQLVPVGVPGELYIGGTGIARGYLNRPELTAERFIPNPFSKTPGTRLYQTGDRVRYLSNGNIEYLGRLDNQVKIRGFRIELGEIEALLSQYSNVGECVVVAFTADSGDKYLVAYTSPEDVEVEDLREYLTKKLPGYMIPAYFVSLPALPKSLNGKIDRKALPKPQQLPTQNIVNPRTPTEELLTGIWQTVLNLEAVGIEDNFFVLGGHSLLAMRIISQIQQVFEIDIPLRQIFETPTIAELAEVISSFHQTTANLVIPRVSRDENLPLSFAQQRLWFLTQLEPESSSYNVSASLSIDGNLDITILRKCFAEIIRRHEVLRTSFSTIDGKPVAVVSNDVPIEIPVIDLSAIPNEKVRELAIIASQQNFQIAQFPLLRVKILYLQQNKYILLLTMHHIITDGWSVDILAREIATIYQAFSQDKASNLTDLRIQYADFAAWQRQQLENNQFDYQLKYWISQLQEVPELLELPIDYPRPAVQTFRGKRHNFQLSSEITQAIKQLSQETNTTLFMVIFLALSVLLHRYSQRDEIVIGTPVANRHYPGTDELIGFFANTLALKISFADNPSINELLPRVRETVLAAYAHQDVPFEQVVQALQPVRTLSHSPLFQVTLVVENAASQPIEIDGLCWSPLEIDNGAAKFDLTLMVTETESGLQCKWEYNCDLFQDSTIAKFTKHLQNILEQIASQPTEKIGNISLIEQVEIQKIIEFGSSISHDYTSHQYCIHKLFEQQVEKTGNVIAAIYIDETLTYLELNHKANQLAHYLISLGVTREVAVGICVDNKLDFLVGVLAILKAGGFYVPLDANYPTERLAYIVTDAQVKVLLTQESLKEKLPFSLPNFCFDTDWETITQQPTTNPVSDTTPENLAYVMYTSGSTGVPKGVCVNHRGVVRLVQNCDYAQLSNKEILLQAAPLVFDASTFEIWGALLNGACLVMIPEKPSLAEIAIAITQHQITTVWLTAGLFHLMVDEHLPSLKSVKQLLAGGDVLSAVHIQKFLQAYPESRIINGYGPTENTTFTCCNIIIDSDSLEKSNHVPIGRAIANTQVYILDKYLNPVPLGIAGELYTTGDGLARGYLNQPDLTAQKFIPNPFNKFKVKSKKVKEKNQYSNSNSPLPNSLLYKTGDIARFLADGNIEYLGRLDNQVKIRGFRVELGEIEVALKQHSAVRDCVVIVSATQLGKKQILAYFVPSLENQKQVSATELRKFLQQRLPDYLIPSFYIPLDNLPLTQNGKIDKKALPTPELPTPNDVDLPNTDSEAILVNIWSSLLNLSSVSIHDNFFELGGDSILAIQIISRANQAGLQITPKQLFQYQTIAELAAVATPVSTFIVQQDIVTGVVPLTPIQHWFFEQELINLHHFNQAVFLQVKQKIQPDIISLVLKKLLEHHDVLRSRFTLPYKGEGKERIQWQAIISEPDDTIPLSNYDLSKLSAIQQLAEISKIATQLQTSLDISNNSLLRVARFDLGVESRLLIVIHHLVIDGVSWRILLEDLQTAYQQLIQEQNIKLPPKTTSFLSWAEKLHSYSTSVNILKELDYWCAFKKQNIQPLPLDYADASNTISDTNRISLSLSLAETQALLKQVPATYNTQINDVLLTACSQAISNWTSNNSVLIDLESYGRDFPEIEIDVSRTVGWFTTIYPIFLQVENSDNWGEKLKSVKEQLRTVPNRGFNYGLLRYLTDSPIQNLPSPEISFNYLGQLDINQSLEFIWLPLPDGVSNQAPQQQRCYLLEITGFVREGKLQFELIYSDKQYQKETINQLANDFYYYLQQIINHCQLPESGGYTPSDFTLANLDSNTLDLVLGMVDFATEDK